MRSRTARPAWAAGPSGTTSMIVAPGPPICGFGRGHPEKGHGCGTVPGLQAVGNGPGGIDRDGEVDVLALLSRPSGVDPDDLAEHVDQRTAGIPRVDGGIGLD